MSNSGRKLNVFFRIFYIRSNNNSSPVVRWESDERSFRIQQRPPERWILDLDHGIVLSSQSSQVSHFKAADDAILFEGASFPCHFDLNLDFWQNIFPLLSDIDFRVLRQRRVSIVMFGCIFATRRFAHYPQTLLLMCLLGGVGKVVGDYDHL